MANAKKYNFQRSVCGGYYTDLSNDVIHGVFYLHFAKVEVIWFDTFVSDQSLLLLLLCFFAVLCAPGYNTVRTSKVV